MSDSEEKVGSGVESPDNNLRRTVEQKYRDLLTDRSSKQDRVFESGDSLANIDARLVVFDETKNEHPRTWPMRKKNITTLIMGFFCFLAPFSSTIFAPSVHIVMEDLHITDSTVGALQISIFLFAYAVGPLILAPMSELYGRTIIQHCGNAVFAAFCIGGGFATTATQLSVCRFFAGVGGSASMAVVGGVVADIWDLQSRPKAQGIIMLGVILGPALGPVCGGWMSELASWRWTLWVPGIASVVHGFFALAFLPESYGPKLLRLKTDSERMARADDQVYSVLDLEEQPGTLGFLISQFARPLVYLAVDPALFLSSLYYGIVFGTLYLVIVTYSEVFGLGYGHSVGIVGVDFLALGIGMLLAMIVTVKVQDAMFPKPGDSKSNYKPESRLLSGLPGALLCAGGLFMYGFSALKTHFMVPLVGVTIFAFGATNIVPLTVFAQMAIQIYSVDGFEFPASALTASRCSSFLQCGSSVNVFRCIFSGAFPLFGSKMFKSLGLDWGAALLGFICVAVVPFIPLVRLPYFTSIVTRVWLGWACAATLTNRLISFTNTVRSLGQLATET